MVAPPTLLFHRPPAPIRGPEDSRVLYVVASIGVLFPLVYWMAVQITFDRLFGPPECLWTLRPLLLVIGLLAMACLSFATALFTRNLHHPRVAARQAAVALLCGLSAASVYDNLIYFRALANRCGGGTEVLCANGKGLAQSARVFAEFNGGSFAPHPAALLLEGSVEPRQLVDGVMKPYKLRPGRPISEWKLIARDVDAHSVWVYCGADMRSPDTALTPRIILAYTKPMPRRPDIRILAFADNHVEVVRIEKLADVFAKSNAARATLHLLPFTLDGPVPGVPPTR